MRTVYSVTALLRYIKQSYEVDDALQHILVKGELSNFTAHRSGHYYFTLKDERGRISCVMFASYARKLQIKLTEGMKVIVHASLSLYEASGTTQLYVNDIQVDGLGNLFLQYEALKKQLYAEGLFDEQHKKQLPAYPMDLAIITAKEGAAIHDMMITLEKRWPIASVTLYPALVQGEQASQSMIERLKQADAANHELIILARGGGSYEDLWCFNEEQLARTIYALHTPIVTGVGHENDVTLVDYVADRRFATPTAAVAHSVPDIREVHSSLYHQKEYLYSLIQMRLDQGRNHLHRIAQHSYFIDPLSYIAQDQLRLAMLEKHLEDYGKQMTDVRSALHQKSMQFAYLMADRLREEETMLQQSQAILVNQIQNRLKEANNMMQIQMNRLDAYNPLHILQRGYAMVKKETQLVRFVHDVKTEDTLSIHLQDGQLKVKVISQEESVWKKN